MNKTDIPSELFILLHLDNSLPRSSDTTLRREINEKKKLKTKTNQQKTKTKKNQNYQTIPNKMKKGYRVC